METGEKTSKGFGDGKKLYQKRALESLPLLVRQAKANQPIFYSDLAAEMEMPNPRNLNFVLGAVGGEMKNLAARLGKKIPPIQCLVINKHDGMPGNGIGWFIHDKKQFKNLPTLEKRRIMDAMLSDIFIFPDWDVVLGHYGLEPVEIVSGSALLKDSKEAVRRYGSGGEKEPHRELKEYIARNPQLFGLPVGLVGKMEYPFPSADCLDVLFQNGDEWVGVEVKGPTSDDLDLSRGLFQCVKYQALMEAEQKLLQRGINCRMVLAISRRLPPQLNERRAVLDICAIVISRP